MQLTENFRRGILMPKNKEAESELSKCFITKPIRIEYLPLCSDEIFYGIWESGLFQMINEVCQSSIDDYEEQKIEVEFYPEIIKIVEDMLGKKIDRVLFDFLVTFQAFLEEANQLKMPIYFIF